MQLADVLTGNGAPIRSINGAKHAADILGQIAKRPIPLFEMVILLPTVIILLPTSSVYDNIKPFSISIAPYTCIGMMNSPKVPLGIQIPGLQRLRRTRIKRTPSVVS